jgi:AcrR family transcriptional regulator
MRDQALERELVKKPYHHGELRQALVDAARTLVHERGAGGFSLSDACRRAGVSTAAPYRHFADKNEILSEVAAQGFIDLTTRTRAEAERHPLGSTVRIVALGRVYFSFATSEPALFRMMLGQEAGIPKNERLAASGQECFAFVVQEVISFCNANHIAGDAQMFALQLWTLVHGAATLTIDGGYAKVAPDLNVEELITQAADRLLFSLLRPAGAM